MAQAASARRIRPKTYSFAVYLVIAVLLIQLAALASVFWFRHKVVEVEVNAPLPPPTATETSAVIIPTPAQRPAPEPETPRLVPGPPRLSPENNPAARIAALNEEAGKFRQQGDFRLSAAALDEAEKLDPSQVVTLTNQASLAEAQSLWDRARDYWKRVQATAKPGTSAEALARERLLVLSPGETPVVPSPVPTAVPVGKRLYIEDVARSGTSTEDFTLRVRIAAGAGDDVIDPGSVGIKLYFFDAIPGGKKVPSSARIRVKFEGARQTWSGNQAETLLASFQGQERPPVDAGRSYYGYLLRIYYKGKLQDERSDSTELPRLYPAN